MTMSCTLCSRSTESGAPARTENARTVPIARSVILPAHFDVFDPSPFLTAPTSSFAVDARNPQPACGSAVRHRRRDRPRQRSHAMNAANGSESRTSNDGFRGTHCKSEPCPVKRNWLLTQEPADPKHRPAATDRTALSAVRRWGGSSLLNRGQPLVRLAWSESDGRPRRVHSRCRSVLVPFNGLVLPSDLTETALSDWPPRGDDSERGPLGDGCLEPAAGVGDHQLHTTQPSCGQPAERLRSSGTILAGHHIQSEDLPMSVGIHADGDHCDSVRNPITLRQRFVIASSQMDACGNAAPACPVPRPALTPGSCACPQAEDRASPPHTE